jgi:hypothetical protein
VLTLDAWAAARLGHYFAILRCSAALTQRRADEHERLEFSATRC